MITTTVEEQVGYVTLDRKETRNAIDREMKSALRTAFEDFGRDDDVRAVVIRGNGRNFSSGGDLSDVLDGDSVGDSLKRLTSGWNDLFAAMRGLGKPIVAQVRGYALAGGLLVSTNADFVVAASDATFGMPQVRVGLLSAYGAGYLPHLVGLRKAQELTMLGTEISGTEAARIGLATRAVPDDELEDEVAEVTDRLLQFSPRTLRSLRDMLYESSQMSPAAALENAQRQSIAAAYEDPDVEEGVRAFLEDRQPEW